MRNVAWLFLAILVAYTFAVIALLLRYRMPGRFSVFVGWCSVPIVFACPLLIPSANIGLRAVSAFVSGDICFKLVEYNRVWGKLDRSIILREYYRLLIPFPVLAPVYPDHKRRLPCRARPWPQILRLLGGVVGFMVALLALTSLSKFALFRSNFALNHLAILPIFVLAIESLSRALFGLERLAGFDTKPLIRNAYLSRTVSEFWQRYNYRIHDWLYRNVFQVTGGRRAPVRSLLLVFLVSGILHEAAFAMATSRLTGYQLAFFTIQGPAALATGRLERLAHRGGIAGRIVAHSVTFLFLAVTSVFFFHGVSQIFPFIYASQSPLP
jgi:hypothetical protein